MSANDRTFLALLAKGLRDLRGELRNLARQPGPEGARGETGPAGQEGPRGEPGRAGRDGKDGLAGAPGPVGKDGARGQPGPPGRDGKDGKDGERGPIGPMPKHEWRGTELRFQQSDKRWGKWTQLRGPSGGGGFVSGGSSSSGPAWNPDALGAATNATPAEFIVKQGGNWVRATYAQMQAWFPAGEGGGATGDGFTVDGGDAATEHDGNLMIDFGSAQ